MARGVGERLNAAVRRVFKRPGAASVRLGLTHKIFGGYLVVISLLVLIAGYGGGNLYQLMEAYRGLVNDAIPAQRALYALEEVFRLQTGNEKKYGVVVSPAIARLFAAQNTEWEQLANTLSASAHTRGERQAIANLTADHRHYAHRVARNMAALSHPKEEGRLVTIHRDTAMLSGMVSAGLDDLSLRIHKNQDVLLTRTRERGDRIIGITLTLGLTTVVVGLVAALGLSVLFTRPVRRLKSAVEAVAQGIFDRKVPVDSGDEIGDLAEAFNRMARQLESLDEVREEFIAYISHELKTPLTSLKEANSLLLDGVAGRLFPRQRKLLGIVQEDCTKIERLISEMLDLSKMEAGMMPFFIEPGPFVGIVHAAVEEMGPVAEKRGISLTVEGDPEQQVLADPSRIRQVMTNLISNAIKFSPEGSPVHISWGYRVDELVCSVTDRGPGVPEADQAAIFEKFHQLSPSALSGMRGSGLGLPIARRIVESHQGRLWIECPQEGGSVFRFTLPAYRGTIIREQSGESHAGQTMVTAMNGESH